MRRNLRFALSIIISHRRRRLLLLRRPTDDDYYYVGRILALYFYFVLMDASLWDKFAPLNESSLEKTFHE